MSRGEAAGKARVSQIHTTVRYGTFCRTNLSTWLRHPPPAPGTHRRTSLVIPSWSLDIRREGVASCQACGESEGGTWRFNSAVAALPLTPAPSRKYCLSATLENFRTAARVNVVSIISSESCMVCVLGNFPHTRFLVHTCLQQTPPAEATL